MIGRSDGTSIEVRTSTGSYPVLVGNGLRHELPALLERRFRAASYAFISDATVAGLYTEELVDACRAGGLDAHLHVFPPGESSKNREEWGRLTDALLDAGTGRDGTVLAVGGGVTGDLGGFVAATYMRGIPVIQVPTSLVAMIDASVGGKTGVDVPAGKNLVGAFHPPQLVLVDPEVVATLPDRERSQGMAEAVKHGAVLDRSYLEELVASAPSIMAAEPHAVTAAVCRSIEIKASVVSQDEQEAGLRTVLNFGHTFGHALEAASNFALGHGSAVAVGMVMEAELGERMGVTRAGTRETIENALAAFGFDVEDAGEYDPERVHAYLALDKKARRGIPRFVLLDRPGAVYERDGWSHAAPPELVRSVLSGYLDAS